MQLSYLRTFIVVVEQRGFSAATQALGISQPAVSQQVQRLERELGVTLLRRGRRGVVEITPCGEAVLDFARVTLAAYNALREELDRQRNLVAGELQLAASTIPGEYLVPQLVADFRAQHPSVKAQVTVGDTADVVRKVLAGECDLGFVGAPVERPGLVQERLAADEVVLVVYPAHPFAGREQVTWEEVLTQPLIVREEGSGTRRTVERALVVRGKTLPPGSVSLTLGSTQAVVQAVRDRLGIGFVSRRAIARVPSVERLPTVVIKGLTFVRDLFIVYEAARLTSSLSRAFLVFVRAGGVTAKSNSAE
jgi:DNA-binding transcriptional LysR family regulator